VESVGIKSKAPTDYEFKSQEEFLPGGNAAAAESRQKRGFPQLLGKVVPNSGSTFPHFHRRCW
jgi:hypothetical protein